MTLSSDILREKNQPPGSGTSTHLLDQVRRNGDHEKFIHPPSELGCVIGGVKVSDYDGDGVRSA